MCYFMLAFQHSLKRKAKCTELRVMVNKVICACYQENHKSINSQVVILLHRKKNSFIVCSISMT